MLKLAENQREALNSHWAERSEFWLKQASKGGRKKRLRERNSKPLILTGHGTSMRIESGTLSIRQGFTHYPQKAEQFRFFKGDLTLPRLIMLLDGSGSISFDVLSWLGEQGVALARIQWSGEPAVFASSAGFTANPANLRWQYDTQASEQLRLEFARKLICEKLKNTIATLHNCIPPSENREIAIDKTHDGMAELAVIPLAEMNDIRAIEGDCAARYFAAWQTIEMKWKAEKRYPIPEAWRNFRARSSILTGKNARNRKASHPINAMLNYAYAVRLAQLQVDAVAKGFDPFAGIMHHPRLEFPAYAYDLIEPERPKVDAAVLAFVQSKRFSGADFILRKDGICRLSPELARAVSKLSLAV